MMLLKGILKKETISQKIKLIISQGIGLLHSPIFVYPLFVLIINSLPYQTSPRMTVPYQTSPRHTKLESSQESNLINTPCTALS